MKPIMLLLALIFPLCAIGESSLSGELPRRNNLPLEQIPGLDSHYGVLETRDGTRLRTILTLPKGATNRIPAMLFVQWLSCDSIELPASQTDGWGQMLRRLARDSGMAMMRTEKAGVGDSEGLPCASLDYETELAHHRDALVALRRRPEIDPGQIFIFGASMGANMAPLVASGQDIAGVMVWGGGAKSWFERTLSFERRAKELAGMPAAELDAYFKLLPRFLVSYLVDRQDPETISRNYPELEDVWGRIVGAAEGTHYGRPLSFHQQAQAQNWAGAWSEVDVPVLVLYGEYDWYEDALGHQLIADIVNRNQPGSASYVELAKTDHHFMRFLNVRAGFNDDRGEINSDEAVEAMLNWLRNY